MHSSGTYAADSVAKALAEACADVRDGAAADAIGEGVVPGGHELDVPPQHEQRNPSTAQYFQYSQLCGSAAALPLPFSAGSAASAREERSMGSKGMSAAPVRSLPSAASRLRREVRCARERDDFSNNSSIERIPVPFSGSQ